MSDLESLRRELHAEIDRRSDSLDELAALAEQLMEAPVEDLHGHAAVQTGQLMGLAAEALTDLIACVRAADDLRGNYHDHGGRENTDDECGLCYDANAYDTARRALGE